MAENLKTSGSGRPETSTFEAEVGAEIKGKLNDYSIAAILRYGNFSNIATCRKEKTEEVFVLKCIKKKHYNSEERELKALKCLKSLDPDKNNIVRFYSCFKYKTCFCFEFELLDISLYDFMERREWKPLSVAEIRPIAQQMLVALTALKSIGVTHSDIKPANILLVNQESKPFKVKLIDFGASCMTSNFTQFHEIQSFGYRAPEVYLGLRPDESVDMWGLGCTLLFLFFGQHFYPTSQCELCQKKPKHVWKFRTPKQYIRVTRTFTDENGDLNAFIDLIKNMLVVDPLKRILPADALNHKYISMEHLNEVDKSPYRTMAKEIMSVCELSRKTDSDTDDADKESYDSDFSLKDSRNTMNDVKLIFEERFLIQHKSTVYHIYESLGLFDYLKKISSKRLSVSEIRPIAKQMLVALSALKRIGV
uniref:Protein kinase domain-containing protein n=1 Tax=Kryptolebias marmoratus TaxID=37003 RepID=A0A3Q3B818_KRYMA